MSHCDILLDWTFGSNGASFGEMVGASKMLNFPVSPEAISTEINRIASLKLAEVRLEWQGWFGKEPPKGLTRDLLVRQLAWAIQEKAFGGHDAATLKLLKAYGRQGADKMVMFRRLKPGTTVIREYQGVRHVVTIAEGGFVWEGRRPDPNNWSSGNIENEVSHLVDRAPWYKIYDIAENLYRAVGEGDYSDIKRPEFERRLNLLFHEHGVGWQMKAGGIVARGSEPFELATGDAAQTMRQAGTPTAANELHEALVDISRRPEADVTGAIQHAMAALECVAREVDGSNDTLGRIIGRLSFPPPLDTALHKLWGFASEQGRHIQEGRAPRFEEAELVVTVASAVSVYLLRSAGRAT